MVSTVAEGFKQPAGIAIREGNLFVADTGNDRIRRIAPDGTVTTIAGGVHSGFADGPGAQALFKSPQGIAFAPNGILYVADSGNHAVRKIANGVVTTVAGTGHGGFLDGPAAIAEFKQPSAVAVDAAGNVWVADTMNNSLRLITTGSSSVVVTTVATQFKQPSDVLVEGAAFVADTMNDAIRVVCPALSATAIYPRSADPNGSTMVRVFGAGFVPGAMRVVFGGVAATNVTYVTSSELRVAAPRHPIGFVDVVVSSPNGVATLQNTFQYVPPYVALRVTPTSPTLAPGQKLQFAAAGIGSDNSSTDITSSVSWNSSQRGVAIIDLSGLATGVGAGTTSITATFQSLTQSATLTVAVPDTIPPDPSTVATPIDGTVVTSISDSVPACMARIASPLVNVPSTTRM